MIVLAASGEAIPPELAAELVDQALATPWAAAWLLEIATRIAAEERAQDDAMEGT